MALHEQPGPDWLELPHDTIAQQQLARLVRRATSGRLVIRPLGCRRRRRAAELGRYALGAANRTGRALAGGAAIGGAAAGCAALVVHWQLVAALLARTRARAALLVAPLTLNRGDGGLGWEWGGGVRIECWGLVGGVVEVGVRVGVIGVRVGDGSAQR